MTAIAAFTLESPVTQAAEHVMGYAFVEGAVPSGQYLSVDAPGAAVSVINHWPDGSVRMARVAGAFSLTANVVKQFNLSASSVAPSGAAMVAGAIATALGGRTDTYITLGSGTVALHTLLASPARTFIATDKHIECHYMARVPGDSRLYVWLHVRLFATGKAWASISWGNGDVSNTTYDTTGMRRDYAGVAVIGGVQVWNSATFKHSAIQRHTCEGWIGTDPQVTMKHDFGYLLKTDMFPNYAWQMGQTDQATIDSWSGSTKLVNNSGDGVMTATLAYTPGANCCLTPAMGAAGFQDGIGPLPNWDALLFTSQGHPTFYRLMEANSKALGSFGVAWVDPVTLDPMKISDYPTNTAQGVGGSGGYPIVTVSQDLGTNFVWEEAHVPMVAYAAWLATSDYRYMEMLAFNALSVYMAFTSGNGSGTARILGGQVRGQAWGRKLIAVVAATFPEWMGSLYGDYGTWLTNNVAVQADHYSDANLGGGAKWLGMVDEYSNYTDGTTATPGVYTAQLPVWGQHFNSQSMDFICKIKPVPTSSMAPYITFRNFVLQNAIWCAGGTGPNEFNFGYLAEYLKSIRTDVQYDGDYSGPKAAHFTPTDPGMIFRDTFNVSANATTNTLTGSYHVTSPAGYYSNWLPAIAGAVDCGIAGASAAFARFIGADNFSSQSVDAGYKNTPLWSVTPMSYAAPVNMFTPVDSGVSMPTPVLGPTLMFGATPLWPGKLVFSKYHGFGTPLADIAAGGESTSPVRDAIVADAGSTNPAYEILIRPGAFAHGTYDPDETGGGAYSGDGTYDPTTFDYLLGGATLNSAAVAFGTPPAGSTVTGVSVTPTSVTQSGGTIQFNPVVAGTGSFSIALSRSVTGGGSINSSNLFTLPAQTTVQQTVTITWTSIQDPSATVATASIIIPALDTTAPDTFTGTIEFRRFRSKPMRALRLA